MSKPARRLYTVTLRDLSISDVLALARFAEEGSASAHYPQKGMVRKLKREERRVWNLYCATRGTPWLGYRRKRRQPQQVAAEQDAQGGEA